jgi:hypothetical protein
MPEQFRPTSRPTRPDPPTRRWDFPSTADWWEALTGAQRRDYIEREGCPPVGAIRAWRGPQDPGFSNS